MPGSAVIWNAIAFETLFIPAKANRFLIAEKKEVHSESTEIGSRRARRNPALFSVFSVVNDLSSVNSV